MKVGELLEILQQTDPELEIVFHDRDEKDRPITDHYVESKGKKLWLFESKQI